MSDFLITATYIGRHDDHLHIPIQLSPGIFTCAPVGPNCTQTQFNNNGNPLLLPNYQSILAYESIGRGNYDALQIAVEKRFKRGLEFTSNFTWSKNLDQSSQASISNVGSIYNPFNPNAAYGISDYDVPRIWNSTFVYQMPALHQLGAVGQCSPGWLADWWIVGLALRDRLCLDQRRQQSSSPCGDKNAPARVSASTCADRVPGTSLGVHQGGKSHWLNQYFNTAAFTPNAPGTFGTSGRNSMFGPGWNEADLSFSKNFSFRERYRVQLRWEMFNAFNRTEFRNPNNDYNPISDVQFRTDYRRQFTHLYGYAVRRGCARRL